ncbi:hypothetical protein [Bradyrhizobium sp. 76]|uniref:hypothetical protein n=1 Tax=Bradyrhizobium sp. 76 TaxID=2782680 RepID=UPI001FF9B462|nr:hypothetical protein [Bradyrhizobium sp. 76]MCK1409521.1 hypothetical protein [Bradyrhizobium sp. 76]
MNFKSSTDQSLLAMWQSIRRQVAADDATGGRYRFIGPNVRAYAEQLQNEIEHRKLRYTPIRWQ